MSTKDIAWLAGLLEGEATFNLAGGRHSRQQRPTNPRIVLCMTDEDVCRRAHALLGGNFYGPYRGRAFKPHYKSYFRVDVTGRRAVGWMMTLYSLLGERRQGKVRQILEVWRSTKPPGWHLSKEGREARARRNDKPVSTPQAA